MKIAMIFPGYGSQFVGMGKDLYDESRTMQEYFEQAGQCLDVNFVKLCFASSDTEIGKMLHAYASLFLVSSSIAALLKEMGIKPDIAAGYGVGQYAAIHTLDGITFADGLYLLSKFSLFWQDFVSSGGYAIARIKGCSEDDIKDIFQDIHATSLHIAAIELPQQYIISGTEQEMQTCLQEISGLKKVRVEELPLEYGLHSHIMQDLLQQFEIYFEKVDFKDTQIPLIASSSAQLLHAGRQIRHEVIDAEKKTMLWLDIMHKLKDINLILCIGPGSFLQDLCKQVYPEKEILVIQKPADVEYVKKLVLPQNSKDLQTDETIGQ